MTGPLRRARLLATTASHLRPAQVLHRLRLRALKAALGRFPALFHQRWVIDQRDGRWPRRYRPLDSVVEPALDLERTLAGQFEFLGLHLDLGVPIDWTPQLAPQLWRYHLHYWEWAWGLALCADRPLAREQFRVMWESWRRGTTFGRWDEWSPYVVSLRTWVLCGLFEPLVAGTGMEQEVLRHIGLHVNFVAHNLEFDVGGNHLIKNLKALIGGAVFLGDRRQLDRGRRLLQKQLDIQILDDGGHFERSPSYHAQVLGDLLDIATLLDAASEPPVDGLDRSISAMQEWLSRLVFPDGDVPVLNDATYVGFPRLRTLGVRQSLQSSLDVLKASGYAVLRSERFHAVVDVGPPCPPELPAHAQADCLSFELAVDGSRVIVDPGTSTYEPGPRRAWERSTRSHNTVTVDDQDQTEVWGSFRAARLAMPTIEAAREEPGEIVLTASHDGYQRLRGRPRHRRTWRLLVDRLVLEDEVLGSGRHELVFRMQFAPRVAVTVDGFTVAAGPLSILFDSDGGEVRLSPPGREPGGVATEFGPPEPAAAVDLYLDVVLPVCWRTIIELRTP